MIVLAGGIGSGKSVVARILRLKGFGVFDCDYEARVLMETNKHLIQSIIDIAGDDVYSAGGKLNRQKLSALIFNDIEIRDRINKVVHAAVRSEIVKWLKEDPANIFVETAIAAESGLPGMAEQIWIVKASDATRISRVMARDGRSEENIKSIMHAQAEEEDRMKKSNVLIKKINNDSSDMILEEINRCFSKTI